MLRLYLQKQDNSQVLIGDEFFDIPLYKERDWVVMPDEESKNEIETIKSEFHIEEKPYRLNIVREATLDYCQKGGKMVSFLPPLRSHILFCWALPLDFSLKQFLQMISRYQDDIKFIRLLYHPTLDSKNIPCFYSVIVYFKGQVATDNFYQEFNCQNIGPNGEALYLVFVSKVYFISQEFEKSVQQELIPLDACVELPQCPVCVERLDGSASGINFDMMKKNLIYDNEERWGQVRQSCITCKKIKRFFSHSNVGFEGLEKKSGSVEEIKMQSEEIRKKKNINGGVCETCENEEFSWICLICGRIGCGRYSSGHAKDHSVESKHVFCLELETLRIWDYLQDMYVHRIARSRDHLILNLPDTGENGDSMTQKIFKERMEMITWEYNYLLGTQLEEQRRYYEEKLASLKKNKEDSPRLKDNEEKIKILRTEKDEMLKKIEEYEKESKMFTKKVKMVKDKVGSLTTDVEQLKVFNQSIEENLSQFPQVEESVEVSPEIQREREKVLQLSAKLTSLFSKLDE